MFTKEYIELCKSDKIQGLTEYIDKDSVWTKLYEGDWSYNLNPIFKGENLRVTDVDRDVESASFYWLPTGDQLDEEIVRICKEKKGIYEFKYYSSLNLYKGEVTATVTKRFAEADDSNPLITKIKLLLKLLKEGE